MKNDLEVSGVYAVNAGKMNNNLLVLVELDDKKCKFLNYTGKFVFTISKNLAEDALKKIINHRGFTDLTLLYKLDKLPDDVFESVKVNIANILVEEHTF